jgi:hypothetical protein
MQTTTTKRALKRATPEQQHIRSIIREQIGHQLRKHYQACRTEELPQRLLTLIKKLDDEIPQAHSQAKSDSK